MNKFYHLKFWSFKSNNHHRIEVDNENHITLASAEITKKQMEMLKDPKIFKEIPKLIKQYLIELEKYESNI